MSGDVLERESVWPAQPGGTNVRDVMVICKTQSRGPDDHSLARFDDTSKPFQVGVDFQPDLISTE